MSLGSERDGEIRSALGDDTPAKVVVRVLIVGSAHPWRMERAVERALRRAGHTTLLLDDRRLKRRMGKALTQLWVEKRAAGFKADFVFLSKCLALNLGTVSRLIEGRDNAMWYHDPQWHRDLHRPDIAHIAAVGRLAKTFFITGFANEWRAHGLRAMLLPAAGDSSIAPEPHNPRFAADVTFIGTGYDPERAKFLMEVAKRHQVRVWGLGWERWARELNWGGRAVEADEFEAVCSSSKITLGVNPARAAGASTYTSDRTWMVLLAGAFLLTPGTPGMKRMLRGGEHCAWYEDIDSCLSQIRYYLDHDVDRKRIQAAGTQFARRFHTYDQRIDNLLAHREFVNPGDE
ncbi:MAG: glycosyltransferase family 1 protein [Gemmatimonadaceae bacterium]|nr:glycosyltransferase family 1 protein [Gemmatimonadaceae bacterium]